MIIFELVKLINAIVKILIITLKDIERKYKKRKKGKGF